MPESPAVSRLSPTAIEKVIFESLPGFFVTANLYRPNQPGRYPAVLLQSGHTQEGKPEPQRLAANLALKGFVALAFDPVGQGEREQTYDRQVDGPLAGWSVNEHIQAGAQSILIGESVARYFIWDAKRALDYLVSRPEVDAARRCRGLLGRRGALTTFIGALDPRVKAVAPACYINSYRLLFAGPESRLGNELASVSSPRGSIWPILWNCLRPTPWLHSGDRAVTISRLKGPGLSMRRPGAGTASTALRTRCASLSDRGLTALPSRAREAIYEWMIRWLKDGQGDFHEQPVKLYHQPGTAGHTKRPCRG